MLGWSYTDKPEEMDERIADTDLFSKTNNGYMNNYTWQRMEIYVKSQLMLQQHNGSKRIYIFSLNHNELLHAALDCF